MHAVVRSGWWKGTGSLISPLSGGNFAEQDRVLDAGCGSGFSASLWMDQLESAPTVRCVHFGGYRCARRRIGSIHGTYFLQRTDARLSCREPRYNFSEGVLHHTPSTEAAMKALAPLLVAGGEFMFYVYRKKGPVREFTDDYVRGHLASLDPHQAWESLRPLTRLGQALSELDAEVAVPETSLFGDNGGRYDVHDLFTGTSPNSLEL